MDGLDTRHEFDLLRRTFLVGTAAAAFTPPLAAWSAPGDAFADPETRRLAYARVAADLTGAPVVLWSTGTVFAWQPGLGGHRVCDLHRVRIQRLDRSGAAWTLIAREADLFVAPDRGLPLDTWRNPFIDRDVGVLHHAGTALIEPIDPPPEAWPLGDTVTFVHDRFGFGPADMTVERYPLYAQDDTFKQVDLRVYVADRAALAPAAGADAQTSVPMSGAATIVSPWLPWMEMGQRAGWLLTQLRLKKLQSIDELPAVVRDHWQRSDPSIFAPPSTTAGTDGASVWDAFKHRVDSERQEGTAIR